jgi:hypothetical protein
MLIDYTNIDSSDTIVHRTPLAEIVITGDTVKSTLKLVSAYHYTMGLRDKDYRQKVINLFEKKVIRKIRKNN